MRFIRCLATLLIAVASVGSARAQEIRGYVQELNTTNGTITLTMFAQGKVSGVKTFNLLKADIPIVNLAGQALQWSDVMPEALVTLKLNSREDVISIVAPLPTMHGTLTEVDPKGSVLKLKLLQGPRTIPIALETIIYLEGKPARLKDLTVGTFTRVTFTKDEKSVVEVRSGKVWHPQPQRKMAVLIEMDTSKRVARLFTSSLYGDTNMLREVPLAKDATCSLSYQHRPICALKMEEITKGFQTTYWVEPVYKKIVHMDLEMTVLVRRTVKALDRENRSLTVLDNDLPRLLTFSPRLKILGPDGPGKMEDIVPGAIVDCGLHPDRKQIEVLVVPAKVVPAK